MQSQRKARIPAGDFADLVRKYGIAETARRLKTSRRAVQRRRDRLENNLHVTIAAPDNTTPRPHEYPWRGNFKIKDGIVLICGDAHYWPGEPSLMHRAFVHFCKALKPKAVIHIGDVIDAPTISRHQSIGWESRPPLVNEIDACKERLFEIEKAAGRVPRYWCLGNHDARFETRLASVAPEYAKIHGVHLYDHFPLWEPCWSVWVNDGELVAKHRFKGGIHAPYNNTVHSGKNIVTGHLHSAKVTPFDDYNGTRYGVDIGCIADTDHQAFANYTEDNPKNWRSAFGVFTFREGRLMYPELVTRWDAKHIQFRGGVFTV